MKNETDLLYPHGVEVPTEGWSSRVITELRKAIELTDTHNPAQHKLVRDAIDDMRFDTTMSDAYANRRLIELLAMLGKVHRGGDLLDRVKTITVNHSVITRPTTREWVRRRIANQDRW